MAIRVGIAILAILAVLLLALLYGSFHRNYVSPTDMISCKIEGMEIVPENARCMVVLERTNGIVEFAELYLRKVTHHLVDGRTHRFRTRYFVHPLNIRFVPDNKRYGILVLCDDDRHPVYWFTEPFTRDDIRDDVVIDLKKATMDESDARVDSLLDSIKTGSKGSGLFDDRKRNGDMPG